MATRYLLNKQCRHMGIDALEAHYTYTFDPDSDPPAFRSMADRSKGGTPDSGRPEEMQSQFRAGAKVGKSLAAEDAKALGGDFYENALEMLAECLDASAVDIHAANIRAGWWLDPETGWSRERNVFEMLALVHSEVSEAVEGHRKGIPDDKLPHHPMIAVELADAIIRILDICGAMKIQIGSVVAEKARFNANRADHKIENRRKAGGKAV